MGQCSILTNGGNVTATKMVYSCITYVMNSFSIKVGSKTQIYRCRNAGRTNEMIWESNTSLWLVWKWKLVLQFCHFGCTEAAFRQMKSCCCSKWRSLCLWWAVSRSKLVCALARCCLWLCELLWMRDETGKLVFLEAALGVLWLTPVIWLITEKPNHYNFSDTTFCLSKLLLPHTVSSAQ